ncbi:dTDP-4-dehydrorhamnose reductase [Winogradskyella sp.]|jgi:dTDP-4-dehydrorhamnose reductase|uniref:dTDP-4-dehydrorhamnose reductase n=1 Tax=Winogradskyella sp. TaxID=1883156 RepID=UPI0025DDEE6D|nr:dTDP-4-dehydrorhamnose reductase [Winogradskyella sp.]MCT4628564.1 dTDP-4-dehydrorhamnose reductase [Winogradskyella sp.]
MTNVLVTGSKGQLGTCIKSIQDKYSNIKFLFADKSFLDITNTSELDDFFKSNNINWCINCAAYTSVDKAEEDTDAAYKVNEIGVKHLAKICSEYNVVLIHISTDFVFDGNASKPYNETYETNPLSIYGLSKLKGEIAIQETCSQYFIIRTSWLYSEYNHNFLKTMLRLANTRDEISVVSDQIGTPTYAKDLAQILLEIINKNNNAFGLYHFSNEGVASWYDFTVAIFEETKTDIKVSPIKTKNYPTPATRPNFSVLDKTKIKASLDITIPHWRKSLRKAILNLNKLS